MGDNLKTVHLNKKKFYGDKSILILPGAVSIEILGKSFISRRIFIFFYTFIFEI